MSDLLLFAYLMVPLLILGIFGNINLLIATIKCKKFHHRNGILVGIISFLDLVNNLFEAADAVRIFLGVSLTTRRDCFTSIAVYQFSFNVLCVVVLSLAIDRFIAVTSPIRYVFIVFTCRYRTLKTSNYIAITVIGACFYGLTFVTLGYIMADKTLVEPCNPPLAYAPALSLMWNRCYVFISVAVIVINVFSMIRLKCCHKNVEIEPPLSSFQKRQSHISTTMFIMMVAYAASCLSTSLIVMAANVLDISKKVKDKISTYVALLVLIDYGCNYYILFWRSHEYRAAFLKQLHLKYAESSIVSVCTTDLKLKK